MLWVILQFRLNLYNIIIVMILSKEEYADIINDPSLKSNINVDEIINTTTSKTLEEIQLELFKVLQSIQKPEYYIKLVGYKFIDEIYELQRGKYIRWINNNGKMNNGGIVMDIKFLDNGIHILCRNNRSHFSQYKFDNCLTFQKMTDEEQIILSLLV